MQIVLHTDCMARVDDRYMGEITGLHTQSTAILAQWVDGAHALRLGLLFLHVPVCPCCQLQSMPGLCWRGFREETHWCSPVESVCDDSGLS